MDRSGLARRATRGRGGSDCGGAVLLEVLLALALFVFAAAVISSGLSAAVERTERLRAQTHALDLAATVLAEVEMGLRPAAPAGPEPFAAPFEGWTWEIQMSPFTFGTEEAAGLQQVTVLVRGEAPPAVQQLTEILGVAGEAAAWSGAGASFGGEAGPGGGRR